MNGCIYSLRKETVFSPLDASSAYCYIDMEERDLDKTAFTSRHVLYRLITRPFLLNNDPETFQRAMDGTLVSVLWQFVLVYLTDIVVFSIFPTDHIKQARRVLRVLYKAGVMLNLKKWKFFAETVHYLGHVSQPGRL